MGTLNGNLVAPSQTLSGELTNTSLYGELEAPNATVAGTLLPSGADSGECIAPAQEVSGALLNGRMMSGAVSAPAAQTSGYINGPNEVVAPVQTVTGTMLTGSVLSGTVRAPAASASGSMTSTEVLSGTVVAPKQVVTGTLSQGQAKTGAVVAPAATVSGTMTSGTVMSGSVTAPAATVISTLAFGQILTGKLVAPMQTLGAGVPGAGEEPSPAQIINETVEAFTTWLHNTEGGGTTNYTNFPFHSLVAFNGSYYGVSDEGIFELGGDTDDGEPIDAFMEFGVSDLDSDSMQRLGQVVFDMRASGMLKLHVTIDGEDETIEYEVSPVKPGLHAVPVPTGRGLRSRNWQFAISNVEGADFDIAAIDFGNKRLNRRA
jgi:hypothetical protein